MACFENNEEGVKFLLEKEANIDYQDTRGWTPLMIAAYKGHHSIVETLIDNGADITLQDKFGKKA